MTRLVNLTGNELLLVVGIAATGGPSPFNEQTTTQDVANLSGTSARIELQWTIGAVVIDGTAYFVFDPPYAGTINSLTYFTGADSFDVEVDIDGTPVTGLSAVTVDSDTPATATATAANTFAAGDPITAVISSTSGSPTDVMLSLNVTWTS